MGRDEGRGVSIPGVLFKEVDMHVWRFVGFYEACTNSM
jgi:hypothetical protein